MRFKKQQQGSQLPEINLVPMLDVLMTVLTFFIIVSMTLRNTPQGVDVQLPSSEAGENDQKLPEPLIVEYNQQEQILIGTQTLDQAQLTEQIKAYLIQNPKGAVLLTADSKLPYEQVVKLLGEMRNVGGERVSLAIESETAEPTQESE